MSFKLRTALSGVLLSISLSSWAGISEEPFVGASGYSVIATENATFGSGVHVHGGLYVGNTLTISGNNSEVSKSQPELYTTGLVVEGEVKSGSGKQIDIKLNGPSGNRDYYLGSTKDGVVNPQNAGTQLNINPLPARSTIQSLVDSKSEELSSYSDTGVTYGLADGKTNQTQFKLAEGVLNVVSLKSDNTAFLTDSNMDVLYDGLTADTYLLVNYEFTDEDPILNLQAKFGFTDTSGSYYSNILWNFTGSGSLDFAMSGSTFPGSILAPKSTVNWNANDINGQLIAKTLNWGNTSQSHYHNPWNPKKPTPVPAPPAFWLFGLGLALLFRQQIRR